jgi:uncharacterized protein YcbK (DUF882 family)
VTISAVGVGSAFSTDASNGRDFRLDDDASQSFAGMMSNAMNVQAQKPEPPKPQHDGTSELDKPESKDDDESEATSSKKTHRHHHASKASAKGEAGSAADASADPTSVDRSVADLDPELQAKLARVMQRVRDETGHDVQVGETYRTQARQNALYAQGRDTNGPVVTWTQSSKHTQGRAADLVLDGGAAGKDAYLAMQKIANEEGLRTLGARDPGHIELRGSGNAAVASDATSNLTTEPADATGPGQVSVARIAQLARVADVNVAQPAQVAPVARVAQVAPVATVAAPGAAAATGGKSGKASGQGADSSGQGDARGYSALSAAVAMRSESSTQFPAQAVGLATGSTAAERTEKILAALDSTPVRPLSQITMAVDNANGLQDRIQLSMRGSSLNTTIDTSDARLAQMMTAHTDDLSRALNKDGITLDSLRVRATTGTGVEATSGVAAATAGQASQSSSDASSHSRFDRGDAWGQQQDQRDKQERQQSQSGGRSFSRQQQRRGRGSEQ